MSGSDDVFTGEYFVSLKGYKIPHKTPDKSINNPPPPGTEDDVQQKSPNETFASPLAAVKRSPLSTFEIASPSARAVQPNSGNSVPTPTKRSSLFMMPSAEGLPEDLIRLFKPLCCDLCAAKLNSPATARLHYESKNHEKKINNWLLNWSEKTGEPIPKRPCLKKGPTGPNALHCDICDLALTSLQHAKQHNMGKKHKNALAGRGKPGRSGYYDSNNKWVRAPKINEEDPTNRFSIGEAFLVKNKNNTETVIVPESVLKEPPPPPPPLETISDMGNESKDIASSGSIAFDKSPDNLIEKKPPPPPSSPQKPVIDVARSQPVIAPSASIDPNKYCQICDISVTSEMHMRLHLAGAKHAKKLRQLGEAPYTEEPHTLSQCILDESTMMRSKSIAIESGTTSSIDFSVFRTPSGQYYCQVCDLSVSSEITLSQHFASKRHLKTTKKK